MDRHRKPELFFRLENEALAEKWLNNYIRFGISLVFLICLVEVVCYFILNRVGALDGSAMNYMVMNVVLPCGLSGVGIGMAALIRRGTKNLWGKACAVSLLYVFLAFVIYTVHYRYPSLSASFAMAIFMTLIYGDWNDGPGTPAIKQMEQGVSKDVAMKRLEPTDARGEGWTIYYKAGKEYLTYDMIFVNKVLQSRMKRAKMGVAPPTPKHASDHRAVWCELH